MSIATVTTRNEARPARDALDWYVEPPAAVHALLGVERFQGVSWDPACGQGTVIDAFHAAGSWAVGTDIVNRGWLGQIGTGDFLDRDRFPSLELTVNNIVTNPPYRLLEPFIERAMEVVRHGKASFLVRLAALEGMSRHERIFARLPLARVWVFRNRVSMPPGGRDIEAKGGAVAFCWWVFERRHKGPPTLGWITCGRDGQ